MAGSRAQADEPDVGRAGRTFGPPIARARHGPTPTGPRTAGPPGGDAVRVAAPDRSSEAGIGPASLIVASGRGQSWSIVIGSPPDSPCFTSVAVPATPPGDPARRDEGAGARAMAAGEGGDPDDDAPEFDGPGRSGELGAGGAPAESGRTKPAGGMLATWAALVLLFHGALWVSGVRSLAMYRAVEQGVARAEARAAAEASDAATRKAIRAQRATLTFWTTLAMIDDFAIEPAAPAVRALLVATLLSALAALVGRPIGFRPALDGCAAAQGFWVLGLAAQAGLMLALRTPDVETSLALLLPAGTYPAPLWVALRQLDPFAVLGWAALIRGGWRRGQANLATSAAACGLVAIGELGCRVAFGLITGGAMRLMLLPDRP